MPTNLPSSFASAAAGQNANRDGRSAGRTDGRGTNSGEWPRQGRSTNGTLTFRRASTTPSSQSLNQTSSSEPTQLSANAVDVSPQRYTRDELLAIFDNTPPMDVSGLFAPGWNPGHVNGTSTATRGWGKSNDTHALPQAPDGCWDASASTRASNLRDMTDEERDLFSGDVNSPVKPPPQNKDISHTGGAVSNGRKTSVSHGISLTSPGSATRPGPRRRETTDTNPYSGDGGLMSPTSATRSSRDDGSFWLGRKNADAKDSMTEEPEEDTKNPMQPFGGLLRNNTMPTNSGFGAVSSPWGQRQTTATSSGMSGMGSFGNFALPGSSAVGEKRPGNTRGESRFANLMPKESSDSMGARNNESLTGADPNRPWRARPRTDTDPFGGEDSMSGSAVLGGAQDASPSAMRNTLPYETPAKGSAGDFGMAGLNLGSQPDENVPLSPSETNPYRSPPGERERGEGDEASDRPHGHGLGLSGPDQFAGLGGGLPRPFGQAPLEGSDRSQTSSVGAKGYPNLGNLGGWPSSATPDRERNPFGGAFGSSLFGPMGDLHSPSLGNLGGVFGPVSSAGLGGSGSVGRGSKLGSLFPPAMQSQMQAQDNESLADSIPDLRQVNALGAIGRNAFGEPVRDTESPLRSGRPLMDIFAPEGSRTAVTSEALQTSIAATAQAQAFSQGGPAPFGTAQSAEQSSVQGRTMVMPDRMRWVYLDPQGNRQGPFTGLEMNDWYKANFFTPDLRVKKLEDVDFEPLGQLIRRIGNSREPFLVPQIGIAHGPPSQSGPFSPNAGGVIQPPLSGAFPSFGRTLTAQEQNDLERRKQEEQYFMAQQRALQQGMARGQLPGHTGLQHQTSAHSLQSQPSFGSITSPITMPPQPPIAPIGGGAGAFLGGGHPAHQSMDHGSGLDMFGDDQLARLSEDERRLLANLQGPGGLSSGQPQQPIGGPSMDSFRSRLPGTEALVEDPEGFRSRLQEFEQLRAQQDVPEEEATQHSTHPESSQQAAAAVHPSEAQITVAEKTKDHHKKLHTATELDNAIIDKQGQQFGSATTKTGFPMPFPPPQSSTPLPAPAPQRVKSNLPEQYASSSRSGTPEIGSASAAQPPSLAPWAKDPSTELHKGPSLKEIQEAEAKKAAKAEEAALAMRRAAAAAAAQEEAAAREREKAAAVTSGLPTTSTWGTASPVSTASSPWAKPAPSKGTTPGLATTNQGSDKKKTLADIQREEEARKLRTKEMAVQSGAPPSSSTGKRYADLAGKSNSASSASQMNATAANVTGAGWATVGAGGKVKIPTGPAAQSRSTSSANVKPNAPSASPAKPVAKPAVPSGAASRSEAMEEFNKWIKVQLTNGRIEGISIDALTQTLNDLPLEDNLIADAVYSVSKTIDGRHFAAEFIRRKKLAEKGVAEKQGNFAAAAGNGGGWNEVAKKSAHKEGNGETLPAGFKVVPGRKKGKK